MSAKPTVFLPCVGEFGYVVVIWMRLIHSHPAQSKIVWAQPGTECLFPSAQKFHPLRSKFEDHARCGNSQSPAAKALWKRARADYRGFPCVTPPKPTKELNLRYASSVKVPLEVPRILPAVDVVLSPRKRLRAPQHNWNGWEQLASGLLAAGFTVGIAGAKDTSADIPATVRAWEHPGGQTAGTIDLLKHCRRYVGGDSGVSHLAAMLDVPSVIIPHGGEGNQLNILAAANRSGMEICEAWQSPELALQTVLSKL